MDLSRGMSVHDLLEEFEASGNLGAGDVAKAVDVTTKMVQDTECNVFLALGGPMVPAGLRNTFAKMIAEGQVDIVITTGANIVHDVIESFGGKHLKGDFTHDDVKLHKDGIGRVGNIFVPNEDFMTFEDKIQEFLKDLYAQKQSVSICELLEELGNFIPDENSFVHQAAKKGVPIFSPGFQDSMLGLQIFMFNQDNKLVIDAVGDMKDLDKKVMEKKKTGAIILGGGISKHYTLGANILKEGLDYAMNITTGVPYDGSLTGARLEEAKSWGKAQEKANVVTVQGDATVLFPLIWACTLDRLK